MLPKHKQTVLKVSYQDILLDGSWVPLVLQKVTLRMIRWTA